MSDHHGNGIIPTMVTVVLGILSQFGISISDLAGAMTLCVGCYTLFINFPAFKKRAINLIKQITKK